MSYSSPVIRTIHHFACSGGTLISKCIQAMHRTVVISEVHPHYVSYNFNSFDPVQLLIAQTSLRDNKKLKEDIFRSRVRECASIARQTNANLVLRDHTQSDYFRTKNRDEIVNKSTLLDVISLDFEVHSLVTIRNPLEVYLSLKNNNWDGAISNFSEYCYRLCMMTEHYKIRNIPIMRYEDFCLDPTEFLKSVCKILYLEFNPDFEKNFYRIPMTGNSGRGRDESLKTIKQLPPKYYPSELLLEASVSNAFQKIASEFRYRI